MNDLEPTNMVDLHNHLVPGVDDGARTMAESLRHLRALKADGVERLAVSPHLDARLVHDPGALQQRLHRLEVGFEELRTAASRERAVPALFFNQEILVPDPDTARKVFAEPRVGIRGTRYVLIEFGFDLGTDPVGVIHSTIAAGRRPVVAHPERYRRAGGQVGIEEIRSWKKAGARLQTNAGSLLEGYGPGIAEMAWRLIDEGLADLIGTDNHADARPVSPATVWRALAMRGAGDRARILLSENPSRILADRDTLPVEPRGARPAA